jgi:transcriptional regulator with XRE-family HTH domain/tetratricopeptide (TPR) repeat protein
MIRALLRAARLERYWSLEEAAEKIGVSATTVERWEQGLIFPRPYSLRKICTVYGKSAVELGLIQEQAPIVQAQALAAQAPQEQVHKPPPAIDIVEDSYTAFRATDTTLHFQHIITNWLLQNARYHGLQPVITLEIKDNSTMQDPMSRRDALRRLAGLPVEYCSLAVGIAVLRRPVEEILAYCAAGITACWHLRKGQDLVFAFDVVARYIPTLKEIVRSEPTQRKAAAELLVQCLLLQSALARNVTTITDAIGYAQQAERYSEAAGDDLLRILSLRTQAAAMRYAHWWGQALQAGEKAIHILETTPAPIPPLVQSYVYAGVATYQSYSGQKTDAFSSLKKAHTTFLAQNPYDDVPIWVDHEVGNLLDNDGLTHYYLGFYKEAIDSFSQRHIQDVTVSLTCQNIVLIERAMAEVSRDDQPRDMELCISLWTRGITGATTLKSNLQFNEAVQVYNTMRAEWPKEKRVKELRDYVVRW